MKTLAIIGSTGSIGKSALEVYENNKNNFKLLALAANTNFSKLSKQYLKFRPQNIFLTSNKKIKNYKKNKNLITKEFFIKKNNKKIDYVISGVSGYEAIKINFDLIKISKKLLIANKETLVCGGKIFLDLAKKNKCEIIPIDSEHHCIDFFLKYISSKKDIKKIYLTASGGPFYNKKINYSEKLSEVINHPTWKMGKKISVDSSTFANKVLELFEAKILFGIPNHKLGIKVETKSNTHAIIRLYNNLIMPIMHIPSMKIPIANSLGVSNNLILNLNNFKSEYFDVDTKKFPLVKLGFYILKNCSSAGFIIFTVLNERLVQKFLKNEVKYGEIVDKLVKLFKHSDLLKKSKKNIKNIKDIYDTINYAKKIKL
tara:strand:- start:5745 stop:6857 length:1113 start_codon:yes stop_codon:yes gene_type:complete